MAQSLSLTYCIFLETVMYSKNLVKLFLLVLSIFVGCKDNPNDINVPISSKQTLRGIVLENGNNLPISGVTVELAYVGRTYTDQSGNFSFPDVSTGVRYTLTAYNANYYLDYFGYITLTEEDTNNVVVVRMKDVLVDSIIDYSAECENVNNLIGNNDNEATLAGGSDKYIIVDMGQGEGIPSSTSKIIVQGYVIATSGNIHCKIFSAFNSQGPWTEEGTVHIWPRNLRGIQNASCRIYSVGSRYIKIIGSYSSAKISRIWFEQ